MLSVYSVYGSELHLILPDDFAEAVNNTQNILVNRQQYEAVFKTTSPEWNKFADLMNRLIQINGGRLKLINEEEDSPVLVKVET